MNGHSSSAHAVVPVDPCPGLLLALPAELYLDHIFPHLDLNFVLAVLSRCHPVLRNLIFKLARSSLWGCLDLAFHPDRGSCSSLVPRRVLDRRALSSSATYDYQVALRLPLYLSRLSPLSVASVKAVNLDNTLVRVDDVVVSVLDHCVNLTALSLRGCPKVDIMALMRLLGSPRFTLSVARQFHDVLSRHLPQQPYITDLRACERCQVQVSMPTPPTHPCSSCLKSDGYLCVDCEIDQQCVRCLVRQCRDCQLTDESATGPKQFVPVVACSGLVCNDDDYFTKQPLNCPSAGHHSETTGCHSIGTEPSGIPSTKTQEQRQNISPPHRSSHKPFTTCAPCHDQIVREACVVCQSWYCRSCLPFQQIDDQHGREARSQAAEFSWATLRSTESVQLRCRKCLLWACEECRFVHNCSLCSTLVCARCDPVADSDARWEEDSSATNPSSPLQAGYSQSAVNHLQTKIYMGGYCSGQCGTFWCGECCRAADSQLSEPPLATAQPVSKGYNSAVDIPADWGATQPAEAMALIKHQQTMDRYLCQGGCGLPYCFGCINALGSLCEVCHNSYICINCHTDVCQACQDPNNLADSSFVSIYTSDPTGSRGTARQADWVYAEDYMLLPF
ncbi:uncharacterized protein BJ171DRAFT_576593 [Polychytrium aggregatum]|uniref:uncharacterized protein n=1 Tax=Polychytrium aggregatum TaxID=110093 RepID=UPI0022FE2416|nr:uncharacterized protein BJ171DRAFT_576593 [Polychytrium aggregatum]KAI9209808.1 hypothetical protein BJ171DRAFT_576593 [Polychytrium aggregatum]